MPVEISKRDIEKYLDYYKDSEKYRIPGRDPGKYNVSDNFFKNIEHAMNSLEGLLENVQFPKVNNPEQGVYAEFTVTGHAKVRKLPGQQENLKTIVGQNSMMLEKGKEGAEAAWEQSKHKDPNAVVFTSDLPRAIHHALVKYRPKLKGYLDNFADGVQEEISGNGGIIGKEKHKEKHIKLIKMALNNGIIPTPLLRSHYHGPRDGLPEKPEDWEKFDVDAFLRGDLCKQYFKEESEMEIRQELEELRKLGMTGRDPFQLVKSKDGKILTENLPLYTFRAAYLAELFSPRGKFYDRIKGRRVNFVGHSSNIDVLSSYFRHFESGKVVLEKADKSKTRGEEISIKVDSNFNYLNDPIYLEMCIERTQNEILAFRETSADDKIRSGNGIMPTEFYVLRRNEQNMEDEKVKVNLDSILADEQPYLILANPGLGKTMFSLDLASRLMPAFNGHEAGELNPDNNYVPVLVRLRELSIKVDQLKTQQHIDDYQALKQVLTSDIASLAPEKIEAYKQDGKRFVFILDGYDELHPSIKEPTLWRKLLDDVSKVGKVIVTSRRGGFSEYEGENSANGYSKTLNIDPNAVVEHLDDYLSSRVGDDAHKLGECIRRQSPDIKNNWLMIYFITSIYNNEPEKLDLQGEISAPVIRKKGLEWYVWDHASRKGDETVYRPLDRIDGESDEDYNARNREHLLESKDNYIRENMPVLQKLETYRIVNDKDMLTRDEALMILKGGWSLIDENNKRKQEG